MARDEKEMGLMDMANPSFIKGKIKAAEDAQKKIDENWKTMGDWCDWASDNMVTKEEVETLRQEVSALKDQIAKLLASLGEEQKPEADYHIEES